jgi:predicted Zn-dependent protease
VKPIPKPPTWLPATLHIAHGLVAGGVGYMLSYAGVLYWHAEPHSKRGYMLLALAIILALFEVSLFIYLAARKYKMRRAWADAAKYLKQDEFQAARISLLELLQYPEYKYSPAPVLFALGTVEQQLGHERQAQVLYRRCGDFPVALKALGMLLIEKSNFHRASVVLRKLVGRAPDDAFANLLLANALFQDGKRGAAEKVIQRALERRPKSQLLRNNLERVQEGITPSTEL